MKEVKRLVASCLASVLIVTSTGVDLLGDYGYIKADTDIKTLVTSEKIERTDIENQIDNLYTEIANKLGIDYKYVKTIHLIAGGQAVYADKKPNIYADETADNVKPPLEIYKANTVYKIYEYVNCEDDKLVRPSSRYLPDALFSVCSDIVEIMNNRAEYDRQDSQIYYDSLVKESKIQILFYESILQYMNQPSEVVNSFYRIYEKLLFDKEYAENVLERTEDGKIAFKSQFKQTFIENGITDEEVLNVLAIIASYDENLALNDNSETMKSQYVLPYKTNYTSRENMMIAAMSLVGKTRYVWGGGHSGVSEIDGINPIWQQVEELYGNSAISIVIDEDNNEKEIINEGFGKCIKPSGSWCPIHGESTGECSFLGSPSVTSIDEYVDIMKNYVDLTNLDLEKYKKLMSTLEFTDSKGNIKSITVDTINGLDCSGYCSWVYNQVTDRYKINYTANYFADSTGITEIPFGSTLYPGDVFAWKTHIILIVGRTSDSNKVYITTESTPNVIRFGVAYYSGASLDEILEAQEIAKQANSLIGGINGELAEVETPHVYCMNTAGQYQQYTDSEGNIISKEHYNELKTKEASETSESETSESETSLELQKAEALNLDSTTFVLKGENVERTEELERLENSVPLDNEEAGDVITYNYCKIGRLQDKFIDDGIIVTEYNKEFKDMYATEIIQYTLNKLNYSYVLGYNEYENDIFNKDMVASSLVFK